MERQSEKRRHQEEDRFTEIECVIKEGLRWFGHDLRTEDSK